MGRITAVVAVIGPGGVGKSSCTLRYLKDVFMTEYDPTIEECYKKTITLDGKRTNIEILDTAGQEEFSMFRGVLTHLPAGQVDRVSRLTHRCALHPVSRPPRPRADVTLSYAHGFMIVFALNDEGSWKEARELHLQCQKKYPNTPTIFVGNKKDLDDVTVNRSDVAKFCHDNSFQYFETSAKTGENVTAAFESIIRGVRDSHFQTGSKSGKGGKGNSGCAIL
eukprot:m.79492 g.79492  ORF g.79492 m.79492 type:complete len:222 (-) comp8184_c0_seq2:523-1188(-)